MLYENVALPVRITCSKIARYMKNPPGSKPATTQKLSDSESIDVQKPQTTVVS